MQRIGLVVHLAERSGLVSDRAMGAAADPCPAVSVSVCGCAVDDVDVDGCVHHQWDLDWISSGSVTCWLPQIADRAAIQKAAARHPMAPKRTCSSRGCSKATIGCAEVSQRGCGRVSFVAAMENAACERHVGIDAVDVDAEAPEKMEQENGLLGQLRMSVFERIDYISSFVTQGMRHLFNCVTLLLWWQSR